MSHVLIKGPHRCPAEKQCVHLTLGHWHYRHRRRRTSSHRNVHFGTLLLKFTVQISTLAIKIYLNCEISTGLGLNVLKSLYGRVLGYTSSSNHTYTYNIIQEFIIWIVNWFRLSIFQFRYNRNYRTRNSNLKIKILDEMSINYCSFNKNSSVHRYVSLVLIFYYYSIISYEFHFTLCVFDLSKSTFKFYLRNLHSTIFNKAFLMTTTNISHFLVPFNVCFITALISPIVPFSVFTVSFNNLLHQFSNYLEWMFKNLVRY